MKNMINTIEKKTHSLVNENTSNVISLKRSHFSTYPCVFFLTVVQILVGRLDSCFLTHTKKYMTPIHALIVQKLVKMFVSNRHIKKPVLILSLWRSLSSKKRLAGRSFFQDLSLQDPGCISPVEV